jgi:two-component system sensor histidine kinase DegS
MTIGVTGHQIPQGKDLSELEFDTGRLSHFKVPVALQDYSWIRLILPLKINNELIGIWFFGSRDPDDLYSQAELPLLQSLADQTAVALSNITQKEQLKAMYEANTSRYEQERLRLARDLHDNLLNEMAAMLMKHDSESLPADFQESYDGLIVKLREIVSDLRPPMLMDGLKFAIGSLVENLSERTQDSVNITLDIQGNGMERYPEIVENNLYRIVQEACENASKYSRAKSINITGELLPNRIELIIIDDGIGFTTEISLKLDDMLANKHFGLAGMHERAELIGAVIEIESKPGQGTQIQIVWVSAKSLVISF